MLGQVEDGGLIALAGNLHGTSRKIAIYVALYIEHS
jgi:hypothetical protein